MFVRRLFAAAAVALAFALPAAAAPIDMTAALNAKPGKPYTGTVGAIPFSIDTLTLFASADTLNVVTVGTLHSVTLNGASVTVTVPILGTVSVSVLDTLTASFDDATSIFSLSKGGVAFVTATPTTGFAWDLVSNLGLTPVDYVVGSSFTINTTAGALVFDLGPDGDGSGTGAISAALADVPLPAAAPLLLAAVGLLVLRRPRSA